MHSGKIGVESLREWLLTSHLTPEDDGFPTKHQAVKNTALLLVVQSGIARRVLAARSASIPVSVQLSRQKA